MNGKEQSLWCNAPCRYSAAILSANYCSTTDLLGDKAGQAAGQDGDEGDHDESNEVPLRPLEDGIQPTVAAHPRQRAFDDPSNPLRNEGSAMATGAGFDSDAKRLAGFGQPLTPVAEITQSRSFKTAAGKLMQHRDDALAVMDIRRRNGDRQREAVLVHREMDFDALDLFATVEAAREAGRRRLTGAAVDDDGAGYRFVAASLPPSQDQAVEQASPQAEPGPAGEQRVQRAERDVAELANGAPLHAAEADMA